MTSLQGNKEPVICCTVESTVLFCCTVWYFLPGEGWFSVRSETPLRVALAPQWDRVQTVLSGWQLVFMAEPGQNTKMV